MLKIAKNTQKQDLLTILSTLSTDILVDNNPHC